MHPDVLNLSLGSYAVVDNKFTNANALGPAGCPGGPTVVFPANKSQLFSDFQTMLTSEMHELQQDTLLDGTLAVVASGDCALDHDETNLMIDYPGSMRGSNVLTVGSVGAAGKPNADMLSAFSDFGSENVDIAAPGEFFVVASIGTSGTYAGATNAYPVCETGVPTANDRAAQELHSRRRWYQARQRCFWQQIPRSRGSHVPLPIGFSGTRTR